VGEEGKGKKRASLTFFVFGKNFEHLLMNPEGFSEVLWNQVAKKGKKREKGEGKRKNFGAILDSFRKLNPRTNG